MSLMASYFFDIGRFIACLIHHKNDYFSVLVDSVKLLPMCCARQRCVWLMLYSRWEFILKDDGVLKSELSAKKGGKSFLFRLKIMTN